MQGGNDHNLKHFQRVSTQSLAQPFVSESHGRPSLSLLVTAKMKVVLPPTFCPASSIEAFILADVREQ